MEQYVLSNWGEKSIVEIAADLETSLTTILELALKLRLNHKKSLTKARRWTVEEDEFLKKYASKIKISDASNLLCRSKQAVYQRVRLLDLQQMIDKKNSRRTFEHKCTTHSPSKPI